MKERTLLLLETIATAGSGASARDLANQLGLPQTTVYRQLSDLTEAGLIEKSGNGYRIGTRLMRLAFTATPVQRLEQLLQPRLLALASETGETAFAARLTLRGIEIFTKQSPPQGQGAQVVPVLGLRPPHVCSAAIAILSYLPADQASGLLADVAARYPGLPEKSPKEMADRFARTRESGMTCCIGEEDADLASAAAPLRVNGRTGVMSIGILGPRRRIEAKTAKGPIAALLDQGITIDPDMLPVDN